MKFTLSWLKRHLETTASVDAIAERLTMLGLEVESLDQSKLCTIADDQRWDVCRPPTHAR